jgi:hypothetical protein
MSEEKPNNPADVADALVRKIAAGSGLELAEDYEERIKEMRDWMMAEFEVGTEADKLIKQAPGLTEYDARLLARAMGSNIESREIADGVYQHVAKETPMRWTSEFPTKPGLYWARNELIKIDQEHGYQPDPEAGIVRVYEDSSFCYPGSEVPTYLDDLVSAEWFGPIEPPE